MLKSLNAFTVRILLILIYWLGINQLSFGQSDMKTYYDRAWQKVKKAEDYYFYSTLNEVGSKWLLINYYKNGNIQMRGLYTYPDLKTADGEFAWNYENGHIRRKSNYKNGHEVGETIYYLDNGNVQRKEIYEEGFTEVKSFYNDNSIKFEGRYSYNPLRMEINLYYPNGLICYNEKLDSGKKFKECHAFDEKGNDRFDITCNTIYAEMEGKKFTNSDPFVVSGLEINKYDLQDFSSYYSNGLSAFRNYDYKTAAQCFVKASAVIQDSLPFYLAALSYKKIRNTSKYIYYLALASMYGSTNAHQDIIESFDYLTTVKTNFENPDEEVIFDSHERTYKMKVKTFNGLYSITKNYFGETSFIPILRKLIVDSLFKEVSKNVIDPASLKSIFELQKFVDNKIKHPRVSINKGIEGRVIVEFYISEKGKVEDVKILKGIKKSVDDEVFHVISNLTKWTPITENGKPIRFKCVMPIDFSIGK